MVTDAVMTIQMFSTRTGLPASTLRYYEKERLIVPKYRGDNGYRMYGEEQIPDAIKIHSLRLADINLSDIRAYLRASKDEKVEWIMKWRGEIDGKLSALQVARQYLQGIESNDQHLQLTKWDVSVPILWFPLRVKKQLNPYAAAIEEKVGHLLKKYHLRCDEAFIQPDTVDGEWLIGRIGFRLSVAITEMLEGQQWLELEQANLEWHNPALFVTLECGAGDAFACFNLMLLLQSFGFEPVGRKLERYSLRDLSTYQWMIPVHHAQKGDRMR